MGKTARDIMSTEVVTTTPCATAAQVASVLAEKRISGMPVVSECKVVGVITEADLLGAAECATVQDLMTAEVISVGPDTCVSKVTKLLAEHHIKRVPVLACEGKLVGIVSRADVIAAMAAGE